jgi:hypothetical protein
MSSAADAKRRLLALPRWPASASTASTRATRSTSDTGRGARRGRPRCAWRPTRRRRSWSSFGPVRASAARRCAIPITATSRPIARRQRERTGASGSGSTRAPMADRAGLRSPTASRRRARPAVRHAGRRALTSSPASCRLSTARARLAARACCSRVAGAGGGWPSMRCTCATRRTGPPGTTSPRRAGRARLPRPARLRRRARAGEGRRAASCRWLAGAAVRWIPSGASSARPAAAPRAYACAMSGVEPSAAALSASDDAAPDVDRLRASDGLAVSVRP